MCELFTLRKCPPSAPIAERIFRVLFVSSARRGEVMPDILLVVGFDDFSPMRMLTVITRGKSM